MKIFFMRNVPNNIPWSPKVFPVMSVTIFPRKPMKILENPWKFLKIHGNSRKPMKIHRNSRKSTEILENAWKSFENQGNFWKIKEILRKPKMYTKYKNLFLAGDWGDTGLPATIEGAITSGYNVANYINKI